jgi:hypothetical protein
MMLVETLYCEERLTTLTGLTSFRAQSVMTCPEAWRGAMRKVERNFGHLILAPLLGIFGTP